MRIRSTAFVAAVLVLGWLPAPAGAQNAAAPPAEAQIDVSKLPVNLTRLQNQLRASSERADGNASRLRFTIDVYGRAPRIQLITPEDNVRWGQAPYGGPTHREMMDIVTPREFRSPVMDFSNLMRWIQSRTKGDKQ
jgi:hypothetical protein